MKTTISTASPVRIGRQRRMSEPTGPKPSSRKGYSYLLYEELLLSLSELLCRTRGHDGRKFVCSYQGRLLTLDRMLPYWEYILVLFSRSGCNLWEWQQLIKWPAPVLLKSAFFESRPLSMRLSAVRTRSSPSNVDFGPEWDHILFTAARN